MNGNKPVVMIFAREINDDLTSLVKKVDKATKDSKGKMGSFVVFCNDDEKLEGKLKDLAKSEKLTSTILSIDSNRAGPYSDAPFASKADVTVMLYVNRKVKANHTFEKGKMKVKQIEAVIDDLPKILPKK
jgi:hypothetical protein